MAAYQIRVGGRLDARWSEWLGGMAITYEVRDDGATVTTITGHVADQAALRGMLVQLWDQNLRLISVTRVEIVAERDIGTHPDQHRQGGNECEDTGPVRNRNARTEQDLPLWQVRRSDRP